MLETFLAAIVYAAPYASGLLIAIALTSIYTNFREARRAPYFRLRRGAAKRGRRWILVLLVGGVALVVTIRSRSTMTPPEFATLWSEPTPTPMPSPTPTPAPFDETLEPTPTPTTTLTPTETIEPSIAPLPDAVLEITEFSGDISPEGNPIDVGAAFPAGLPRVYCWFRYDNMTDGVVWSWMLFSGGAMIRNERGDWEAGESGVGYYYFSAQDGWALGDYEVRFYIGNRLADSATFTITGP